VTAACIGIQEYVHAGLHPVRANIVFTMEATAKPVELIMARNLISSLSTPAILVDKGGQMLFFNDAAGAVMGRRFEEAGRMPVEEWTSRYGPLDQDEKPIPYDDIPATVAVRDGHPTHGTYKVRIADGSVHEVDVTAVPILTADGSLGGMVFFWIAEKGGAG
jgi:PAS domain-containing protein